MGKCLLKILKSFLLLLFYDCFLYVLKYFLPCLWSSRKLHLTFAYRLHFEIGLVTQCFSGTEIT